MAERQLHVFVDESGDNQLDSSTSGTSHLFHLVAIVVNDTQKSLAEEQLNAVSRIYFGGGEIKSKHIGTGNARRLRVLEAINTIDFGYYGLIVNKDKIDRDSGYRWKKSFYKATRSKMYAKLTGESCDRLLIYSHRIGSKEYMDSFASYLSNITAPNLFYQTSHSFIGSEESRLVQLADLIAGTLSYCFDVGKRNDFTAQFRSLLAGKELAIDVWPITLPAAITLPDTNTDLDKLISSKLLDKIRWYLSELSDSNSDEDKMRELVLSKLLYARLYGDNKEHAIYSDTLVELLASAGYGRPTKQVFTSNIIGKIRDAGVILAGTSVGYKLALSTADISDYLAHNRSVIFPMFSRIMKAQETVKAATANEFDILEKDRILKEIVMKFYDLELEAGTAPNLEEYDESLESV